MGSINLAVVGGKVGETGPIVKSGTGEDVTNFTVLAEETRKERGTGKPRRVAEWHRITAYGELAQVASKLTKDTVLTVQGRFQHNRRIERGVAQHSVDIIAEKINVVFVPKQRA